MCALQLINDFNLWLSFSKSYNYQIRTPPTEAEPESPKYKFDYTLQAPVDEKPIEQPERAMYTMVDRMSQDQPGKFPTTAIC